MKKPRTCKLCSSFFGLNCKTFIILLVAVFLGAISPNALAQSEVGAPASVDLDLNGVAASKIEERFGKPDRKVKSGSSNEMWYFDRSVVFFTSKQVVGWTHPEDLLRREIDSFKYSGQGVDSKEPHGWKNAWTREPLKVDAAEILDELLSDNAPNRSQ